LKVRLQYKETNSNVDQIVLSDVDVGVLSAREYSDKQPAGTMTPVIMIIEALICLVAVYVVVSIIRRPGNASGGNLSEKDIS
jgi:hypothetical protein